MAPRGEFLKAARQAAVAVVLIAVSAWLAHLHVVSQSYHPVVRLAAPDGLTYTAVQDAKHERQACGAANDRFLRPIKQGCRECQVVIARCERHLEGFELDLHEGRRIPHHLVFGPGVRMAIVGPAAQAKASCEQIASQMVRNGLRSAACVQPS
ncbi:MAG: hypothetical protein ACREU7_00015 [Burkholderiales bacterium]